MNQQQARQGQKRISVVEAKVCFLTASELYYEEFRKKEYYALDKSLFIRKPIDNKELLKEVNRIISSA